MDTSTINSMIEKKTWISGACDKLSSLQNANFQSLLLDVLSKKAKSQEIKDINNALKTNPFVAKCDVDQKTFLNFDLLAYDLLPEQYQPVELSPLEPFGVNQCLAWINQKRIFSTTRNSEIISDPTMALALLSAQQRSELIKKDRENSDVVSLATSHRITRQEMPKKQWYTTHFRNFTISSAGRDQGFEKFEKQWLAEHFSFFIELFDKLNSSWKYNISDVTFVISNVNKNKPELMDIINGSVIENLRKRYPDISFKIDDSRQSNYYSWICYSIVAKNKDNQEINIWWGGFTDRTKKLTASDKERLLVGSVWTEVIAKLFKS